MSKTKGPQENFRLVVYPRQMTDFGFVKTSRSMFYSSDAKGQKRWEEEMQERCEGIAAEIKRHVDNVGAVGIEWDEQEICEHCGAQWTEQSADYNGGCCTKDEESSPLSRNRRV